jgi:hypothetical protein
MNQSLVELCLGLLGKKMTRYCPQRTRRRELITYVRLHCNFGDGNNIGGAQRNLHPTIVLCLKKLQELPRGMSSERNGTSDITAGTLARSRFY